MSPPPSRSEALSAAWPRGRPPLREPRRARRRRCRTARRNPQSKRSGCFPTAKVRLAAASGRDAIRRAKLVGGGGRPRPPHVELKRASGSSRSAAAIVTLPALIVSFSLGERGEGKNRGASRYDTAASCCCSCDL